MSKFRLEFNEEQQCFHHATKYDMPSTFGWITILEECDFIDSIIFLHYIDSKSNKKLTNEYLIKSAKELQKFKNNLIQDNIMIINL